jgi:hypothetical protein
LKTIKQYYQVSFVKTAEDSVNVTLHLYTNLK